MSEGYQPIPALEGESRFTKGVARVTALASKAFLPHVLSRKNSTEFGGIDWTITAADLAALTAIHAGGDASVVGVGLYAFSRAVSLLTEMKQEMRKDRWERHVSPVQEAVVPQTIGITAALATKLLPTAMAGKSRGGYGRSSFAFASKMAAGGELAVMICAATNSVIGSGGRWEVVVPEVVASRLTTLGLEAWDAAAKSRPIGWVADKLRGGVTGMANSRPIKAAADVIRASRPDKVIKWAAGTQPIHRAADAIRAASRATVDKAASVASKITNRS